MALLAICSSVTVTAPPRLPKALAKMLAGM